MVICFDLDGTLIDSTGPIVSSLQKALQKHNIKAQEEDIKKLIGDSLENMFASLGVKEKQISTIMQEYNVFYAKNYIQETTLLNGAREAVELAKKNAKVCLVTTKTNFFAKELLKNFKLHEYFDVIVGGDEVSKCKPNPEPIFLALSKLANRSNLLSKEELKQIFDFNKIYMIGDTLNDIFAAKTAEIKAIATLFEYTDLNILKNNCEQVFTTPLECVQYIINCEY